MSSEINIPSPLKEILKDYLHVEWIDEELLHHDMESSAWEYDKAKFISQLRVAIDEKNISPKDYFKVTGDELDTNDEVSKALKEIWDAIFY